MATNIAIDGGSIQFSDWKITVPTSETDVAPSATIQTAQFVGDAGTGLIQPNDSVIIEIDGATIFSGYTLSSGTIDGPGGLRLQPAHESRKFFEEYVSIDLTTPTVEEVLSAALTNSENGSDFSLSYAGTAPSLGNDYSVTDRQVKKIFRDMMDRTNRVWWVDPAGTTIHVEELGGRGTWQDIDTSTDTARVTKFTEATLDSIRNHITVVGTGEEEVRYTATNSNSIGQYGKRTGNSPYNYDWITTESEAETAANALLQTADIPEGKVIVGSDVGAITEPLVNYEIPNLDDPSKYISINHIPIREQEIKQGRATLSVGGESPETLTGPNGGTPTAEINRQTKSTKDNSQPGSVYNTPRIADNAIVSDKIAEDAVDADKLVDLSITETKITDSAISTPKLQANAITTNEIAANAVTTVEIAANTIQANDIESEAITANEILANTITAGQIDTLDLSTGELTVGLDSSNRFEFNQRTVNGSDFISLEPNGNALLGAPGFEHQAYLGASNLDGNLTVEDLSQIVPASDNVAQVGNSARAFSEMHAHDFVTASPDAIDGVDLDTVGDTDWYDNPPAEVVDRARAIGPTDAAIPDGLDHTPVELGTMANWLLEVCKAQQDRLDDLAERITALESNK